MTPLFWVMTPFLFRVMETPGTIFFPGDPPELGRMPPKNSHKHTPTRPPARPPTHKHTNTDHGELLRAEAGSCGWAQERSAPKTIRWFTFQNVLGGDCPPTTLDMKNFVDLGPPTWGGGYVLSPSKILFWLLKYYIHNFFRIWETCNGTIYN